MDRRQFDTLIKEKIQQITVPETGAEWHAFEEMQQKRHQDEMVFDTTLRNKLNQIRTPHREKHWLTLQHRLEEINTRLRTISVTKLLECAGILIICSTYFYHPTTRILKPFSQKEYASVMPAKENSLPEDNTWYGDTPCITHKAATLLVASSPGGELRQVASRKKSHTQPAANILPGRLSYPVPVQVQRSYIPQTTTFATLTATQIDTLAAPLLRLPDVELSSQLAFSLGNLPVEADVKKGQSFFVSAYATVDVNMINTPFDKLYSVSSYKKEALNNSYGLMLSGRRELLEWETGIEYADRRYSPESITETFGQGPDYYFETSLKKIQYGLAGIPVHLKYHVLSGTSWSAYLMSSVQCNVVLNAAYEIQESLRHGRPAPGRYTPEAPRLEEKRFIKGVLQGDRFSDNFFVAAGLGIGLQGQVCKGTWIYLQPLYMRHILSRDIGIGPNKDKIHGISIQFGVKREIR